MSAIFGILYLTGEQVNPNHLKKMQTKLRHYGRDKQAIEFDNNIGLGCCLNTAISQSPEEVPICRDEDFVLIGDVLIYNRAELIAQLTAPRQISNLALLLAAYKKWGTNCPKYINGDFVFVIWEKRSRQLLIVRDHLGVRPLYYFYNGASFAFATDLRALLALPFVGRQFDEVTLYAAITDTYHIDPEASNFAQIKRLPQAHLMKVDAHGMYKQKYWKPGERQIAFATEADYTRAMYDVVTDAIKIRVADRAKMGAELSGGLDSSVVTILANRESLKEDTELVLFSWSPLYEMLEKQPGDERSMIELICRQERLIVEYNDPRTPADKNINELLPTFAGGEVFHHEYQHFAEKGVKLILTGWGGDEAISLRCSLYDLFANGYWRHFWEEAQYSAKGSPRRFFKILANTAFLLFDPHHYLGNRQATALNIANKKFANNLKPYCKKDIVYFSRNPVKNIESGWIQARTELTAWLGAHYNVQSLYPLLDYRVVDFAMSIPRHWFLKQGMDRYLFRKTFAHILPPEMCGFLTKTDIAKETYFRGKIAEEWDNLILLANQLQRDLFSAYIDWDKLDKILYNSALITDFLVYFRTYEKIHTCYNIQQILAEASRDS